MTDTLSHHDIYDAALDKSLFDTLPQRLAQEMDVPSAIFFWLHPGNMQEISAGTQPEANADYIEILDQDPWMAEVKDEHANIGAFRLSNHVSADTFERSAMYNEITLKHGLDRFWCLGMIQDTRDGRVVTAFHKGKNAGDFSDPEVSFVNRHARDLARLHSIRRELIRSNIHDLAATDRTLQGEVPIFELDFEGRLKRLNGLAEGLLLRHPFLILQHSGILALGGPKMRSFHAAVARATDVEHSQANWLDLPQTRADDGRVLPSLRLNFLPQNTGGRRVLVIVTTEDPRGIGNAFDDPQEKIRLTPRERDILNGLIKGRRRDQLAHDLGVTIPTVDLHSGNLRRKLGANTMMEAIANAFKAGVL
jgi:DNA-binding CsgD family transcriptional regulator